MKTYVEFTDESNTTIRQFHRVEDDAPIRDGMKELVVVDNKPEYFNSRIYAKKSPMYKVYPDHVDEIYEYELHPNYKDELIQILNGLAEDHRLNFITPGYGQSLVYLVKRMEAFNYLKDPNNYHLLLDAELGITGNTLDEVANTIIKKSNDIIHTFADIEHVRLSLKKHILDGDKDVINTILSGKIDWSRTKG